MFDMFPDSLLSQLGAGISIIFVTQSPWILAVLSRRLAPGRYIQEIRQDRDKRITEVQADRDAAVTAANAERDRAREETNEWKTAYEAATKRGDLAIQQIGASSEGARSAVHLLQQLLGQTDEKVIES